MNGELVDHEKSPRKKIQTGEQDEKFPWFHVPSLRSGDALSAENDRSDEQRPSPLPFSIQTEGTEASESVYGQRYHAAVECWLLVVNNERRICLWRGIDEFA